MMRKIGIFLFVLFCFLTAAVCLNAQETQRSVTYSRTDDGQVVEVETIQMVVDGKIEVYTNASAVDDSPDKAEGAFYYNPVAELRMTQEILRAESQGKLLIGRMVDSEEENKAFVALAGISEPQRIHIQTKYAEFIETFSETVESIENRAKDRNLSPEELTVLENDISQSLSGAADHCDTIIRETLTPEQLLRAREIDLALPSVLEMEDRDENVNDFLTNFAAYRALDLSEEQSEAFDEMQEQWNQEFQKVFEDAKSKIANDDKDGDGEATEKIKRISAKYQTKIDETLTQEQKEKLATLRKEIPEKLAALQLQQENQLAEQDDSWKNSWKPGDPLPKDMEHLVQPKTPRFPSKK